MRKETVNAKTQVYAIFGEPISHSMSPVIMNSFFDRLEMDCVFIALPANLETFDKVMETMRLVNLKGYVFTMPVKELALKFMDELSSEAEIIGAVNCAVNIGGKLVGYNTDSIGFWNAVQEKNAEKMLIRKAFVMGAGGFARAAVAQAAIQGVKEIVVANIFEQQSFVQSFQSFMERLLRRCPDASIRLVDWKPDLWKNELHDCQLVANATPNGMKDVGDLHQIFPFSAVAPDTIFFDAIYEPRFTKFLRCAAECGYITVEGLDLLVHQGVRSFFNWTGEHVSAVQMKKDVLDFMELRRN